MADFEDSLDLFGDGVVEVFFLQEAKIKKGGSNNNSGCYVMFFALSSSLAMSGWCVVQLI